MKRTKDQQIQILQEDKTRAIQLLATLYTAYLHRDQLNYDEEQEIASLAHEQMEASGLIWKDRRGKWHLWRSREEWSEIKRAIRLRSGSASRGGARSAQAGRTLPRSEVFSQLPPAGAEDRVPLTRA